MATAAISDGPILVFTTQRTMVEVPLSAVAFASATSPPTISDTTPDKRYTDDNITAWVTYLWQNGRLRPGAAPAASPAFTIAAGAGGSTGNDILVDITYPDSTKPKSYQVTLTKTDAWAGLTPGKVKAALAARPGLLSFVSTHDTLLPDDGQKPAYAAPVAPATQGTFTFKHGATTALVLATRGGSADDAKVTVEVATDAAAGTYEVTATWTAQVLVDGAAASAAQITALTGAFGYVAAFSPAAGGIGLPQAGSFFLSGGADVATATAVAIVAQ